MKMPFLAAVTLLLVVMMHLSCETLGLPTDFVTGECGGHAEQGPIESSSSRRNGLWRHCACIQLLAPACSELACKVLAHTSHLQALQATMLGRMTLMQTLHGALPSEARKSSLVHGTAHYLSLFSVQLMPHLHRRCGYGLLEELTWCDCARLHAVSTQLLCLMPSGDAFVLALRVGHILALPLSAPASLSKTRRVPRARAAADASRSSAPTRSAQHEPAQLHDAGVACMTCRSLPPVPSQLHPPQHVFTIMHCVTGGSVRRPGAHPDPDLRRMPYLCSRSSEHPIPSVHRVSKPPRLAHAVKLLAACYSSRSGAWRCGRAVKPHPHAAMVSAGT